MNKWIGLGRLTRDPDYRANEVNENSSFCRFTVAVDRPYTSKKDNSNQPTADFISCICFGKTAKFLDNNFHKGDPIVLEGRIQTGQYEKDGQKVYTTDVMIDKVEFAPKNNGGASGQGARDASEKRRDDYRDIPAGVDEELPFS